MKFRATLASTLRLTVAALIAFPPSVWGNPNLGQVIAGSAGISSSGSTLTVLQTSNNAIINWQGFSISQGELTRFIQPSAASAVLNRVTGGNPSSIYGTLQANGKVFLINPNGVMVGPSGVINTQSFIASTLDVDNAQFMAGGGLVFSGSSLAGIINAGRINALGGDILLIAHTVQNTGLLSAAGGTAAMAAGSEVLFEPSGTERVFVKAGAPDAAATGVDQKGQIEAATAELKAAGGNVYGLAINNSGIIRATGVSRVGGRVYLTAEGGAVVNSGQISAKQGDQGGAVQIVGGDITLKSGSSIDVSGPNGGGTALIGGDSQGLNSDVPNASKTTVEAGATVNADATDNGNGGKVVVWSDDNTSFNGVISAKGGAAGGDAGSAEVSGGYLDFNGNVYLTAANGAMGTLLLDPLDLSIQTSGTQSVNTTGFGGNLTDTGTGNPSILLVSNLQTQLGSSNVTVQTGNGGPGNGGTITVANAVSWNSGSTLKLSANNNIVVNSGAAITNTGSGGVTMLANSAGGNNGASITLNAGVTTAGGSQSYTSGSSGAINLNANNTSTTGGQTYAGAVNLQANETLTTNGGSVAFNSTVNGAKSLTVNAGAGSITFSNSVGNSAALTSLALSGTGTTNLNGALTTATNGAQTYGEKVNLANNATINSNGGAVSFNSTVNGSNLLTVNAGGGAVTFAGAVGGTTQLDGLTVTGSGVTSINGGAVTTDGVGNQSYGEAVLLGADTTLASNTGDVSFGGTVNGAKALTVNAGNTGNISFSGAVGNSSPLTSLALAGTGATTLNSGANAIVTSGAQSYGEAMTLGANTSLTTTNSGVTFSNSVNGASANNQSLTVNAGAGNVSLGNVGTTQRLSSLTLNNTGTVGLNGTVNTNAAQTYNQAIVLNGNSGLTTNNAAITLNGAVNGLSAGGQSLTLNSGTAATNINSTIGVGTRLGGLTVNGTGTTNLNAGTVDAGPQAYNAAVVLDQNTTLNSSGGTVDFNGTLNGAAADAQSLTVNAGAGNVSFNNAGVTTRLNAVSVTGTGALDLNGTINTKGAQSYTQAINLSGNSVLQTNNAAVTLGGAVNANNADAQSLTINAGSAAVGLANVGVTRRLSSFTLNNTGGLSLNGTINTSAAQTYNEAITLAGNSGLQTNNQAITLNSPIDGTTAGAQSLTLNAGTANTNVNAAIGGTTRIGALTVNGTGTTNLNTPTLNTGAETFNQALNVVQNATLNSNGGTVTLNGAVNANTADAQSLTVNAGAGTINLGNVGVTREFSTLTLNGAAIGLNGTVKTNGAQTYSQAITLNGNSTLQTNNAGITLNGTVNGGNSLTLNGGSGNVVINGQIGNTSAIDALTISGTGTTNLNTTAVTTNGTGNQIYGEAVVLGANSTLTTAGGNVVFSKTVDGAKSLAIDTTNGGGGFFGGGNDGNVTFSGAVGGATPLASLSVASSGGGFFGRGGGGTTNLNGGAVVTSGAQTYNQAVSLGANAVLTSNAGGVTFASTVDGARSNTQSLTINSGTGGITFGDDVGGGAALLSLALSGTGTTALNGSVVNTSAAQTYGESVILGNDEQLTSNGGGVTFNGAIDAVSESQNAPASGLTVASGSGNIVFNGAVGGHFAIDTVDLSGQGTTIINGGAINTNGGPGDQNYNEAVTLGANTTITSGGGGVTFGNTVNGPNTLSINTSNNGLNLGGNGGVGGNVTFSKAVGGASPLASLTVAANPTGRYQPGTTNLNGGAITTSGTQSYGQAVVLGGSNNLTTTTGGSILFQNTVDGTRNQTTNLTTNSSGNTIFSGAVGHGTALTSLTATAGGNGINLDGGSNTLGVATTGNQDYKSAVVLGTDNLLTTTGSGTLLFEKTVDGGHNLTTNSGGATTFQGVVGGVAALTSLTATAGGTGINLNGGSNASGVTTTGNEDYKSAVLLGSDNLLNTTAAGTILFENTVNSANSTARNLTTRSAGSTTFSKAVGAVNALASLTATAGGTGINLNGGSAANGVQTTGNQDYKSVVVLGSDNLLNTTGGGTILFENTVNSANSTARNLTTNSSGNTTFQGVVGGVNALASLTATAGGTGINLNGGTNASGVKTTGNQDYKSAVALGTDNLLNATVGSITFEKSVDGAHNLTTTSGGNTTFSGVVGGANALTSLTATAGGTGINLNGGSAANGVQTTGNQDYKSAVLLGSDNLLNTTAAGAILFENTVNSANSTARNLTTNSAGSTTFSKAAGAVNALASLTATAGGTGINLNGGSAANGVQTTGNQDYKSAVLLGSDNLLNTTGGGTILFENTVNSANSTARNLTTNSSGNTTFQGVVGGVNALASLTATAGGTGINLNAVSNPANVTTTGSQDYKSAVVLGSDNILNATAGSITFEKTVDGAHNLTTTSGINTTFGGVVGGASALTSLTATAGGTGINLNGGSNASGVTTTGSQDYKSAVLLGSDNLLNTTAGGAILFENTVNSANSTARSLTTNSSDNTTFQGAVGGVNALASLTATAGGTGINLNGGTNLAGVKTTGTQDYKSAVVLGTDNLLNATAAAGAVVFEQTVDGPHNLTTTSGGNTTFSGVVGGVNALTSLTATAGGTGINLNAASNPVNVTTTGNQDYKSAVVLGSDNILNSTAGSITFEKTVDGAHSLTTNSAGYTTFDGAVGGVNGLASLSATAAGGINLNGASVQTGGVQSYNGDTTLGVDNALTGGAVNFNGKVDGAHNLTASAANVGLNGAVGGQTALNSLTSNGATSLNGGSVQTSGAQNYNGNTTLVVDNTLNGAAVNFNGALDGANNLTVTAANIGFNGAAGGQAALASLTSNGATSLNGGSVQTTGAQNYNGDTTLLVDNILTGGAVNFNGKVDGANNLTATAANVAFNGAVGGQTALTSLTSNGATSLNGGSVQTSGAQNYNGDTMLVVDNTLTGGAVNFNGKVDGANNLTATAANVGLNGAVGGQTALTSLTSNGATSLNGGSVQTTGAQNYNGDTTLVVDNALTGSAVNFNGKVDGANNLTVTAANVGLNGAVGGQTALTSLTSNGSTSLNGGSLQTSGAQNYNGDTTLGVDNTLAGSAVNFNGKVNGANNLTVTAANIGFNGAVGDQTALTSLTATGATSLNGGVVDTNGAQTYNQSVSLGAATTLNSNDSAVTFNATVDGANALTINAGAGNIYFYQMVGGLTPLSSLLIADGLGTTDINGGGVYTNGAQTYGQKVILSADAYLSSHASDPAGTYLTGGDITFKDTVNGIASYAQNLTVDSGIGNITFMGDIGNIFPLLSLTLLGTGSKSILGTMNVGSLTTQGSLDYWNDLFLTSDLTLSVIDGNVTFHKRVNGPFGLSVTARSLQANFGDIDFLGTVGDVAPLASLTLKGTGTTHVDGGLAATSGNQSYGEALALGADTTLTSALGGVSFLNTVNGTQGLTVNTPNGAIDINGGVVNTAGDQNYNGAASLSANASLTSSAGNIGFSSTLDGTAYGMTTNSAQNTTFGGAVNIGSLDATANTINLANGAVTTAQDQTYNGAVALTPAANLTSSNGSIALNGTVTGANGLTTNSKIDTTFGGAVSIGSLDATAGGNINLNAGTVGTIGGQNYNTAVVLTGDNSLTGNNIAFASTIGGAHALTTNSTLDTTFGGAVNVASLDATAGGSIGLNAGTIGTSGDQNYNTAVVLTGDNSLTGNNIAFASTIGGAHSLTTNSTQDTTFGGALNIGSLGATAGGKINLNNGSVTTAQDQTYNGAVALAPAAGLTSTNGNIALNGTVTGANGLTTNSKLDTTFGGSVNVGSLDATAGGNINLNAGTIGTTGDQNYNTAVVLTGDNGLTGNNIAFASTIGGAHALTTNSTQNTTFGGAVNIGSLDATANTINLANGAVTTAQDQIYNGAVALTPAASLTSSNGSIALNGTVTGANGLTTNSKIDTTFDGAVSVGSLDATAGGNINLNAGTIGTTGDQNYNTAVVLTGDNSLTGNNIAFASTIGGAHALTTNSTLDTTFGGAVNVASLDATAGGSIDLNAGTIGTTGDQNYNTAVVLTGDNGLTGNNIAFASTIGGAHSLTTNSTRDTTFGGAVNIGSLGATAGGKINLTNGSVTTAQDQTYNGAVALTPAASLTSSNGSIALNGTVTGANGLTTNSKIDTTFGGAVNVGSLDATAGGNINLNAGTIGTTGDQNYNTAVVLTGDNSLTGNNIAFASTIGGAHALTTNSTLDTTFGGAVNVASLDATAGGSIDLNAGTIGTSGDQNYNTAVVLTGDNSLTGNNIAFASTIDGAHALTTNSTQDTTFGGALNIGSLGATAGGKINLNNGSVTTAQDQTYNGAVALAPAAGLTSTNGNIALNGTVTGANGLTTNSKLDTTFGGSVNVGSLDATAGGNINLNAGSVATSGDQAYHAAVVIGADDSLVSSAGGVIFDKTIDGLQAGLQSLAIDAQSDFTLKDAVGAGTSLRSLAINAAGGAGSILLNGGEIDTAAGQTYGQGVVLGANTTLNNTNALSAVAFDKTLGGKYALTINGGAGDINFLGGVGDAAGITSLISLALTGTGTTDINGGFIYTSGAQTYGEKVVLSDNAWLGTDGNTGSDVTFLKTVNGTVVGQQGLTVDGGANGAITFFDAVGDQVPLSYLTLLGNGVHTLYGGISTTGNQDYWNDLFLTADLTLFSNGGNVTFHKRVNGAHNLTVNADFGDIGFMGLVGDLTPLSSLILTGTGLTTLSGGAVTTTGAQSYGEAVALGANTTLASNGGDVSFGGSVNGAHSLTIAAGGGNIDFGGAVGDTARLTSLSLTGTGVTGLNGGAVNTDGAQTYGEAVALGADTTLTSNGGNVTLNGGAAGAHDLTVDASAASPLSKGGDIAWNALVSVVNLKLFGNDLLMRGDISASGSNGALLVAGHSFQNLGANSILLPGTGRWLIYSIDPTLDVDGGLTGSVQWSTTYLPGVPPGFSGNGFLYADAAPVIAPIIIPIGTINNGDNTGSGGQNNGGVYDGQVGDGGDEGSVSSNWSASPSDIFSWDLGTMRDAVASPDDDVDSYGRRKKNKGKDKAKKKSPWFKEP